MISISSNGCQQIAILDTNDVGHATTGTAAAQYDLQHKSLSRYPCGADAIQVLTYNAGCRPRSIRDELAFEHLAVFKDSQSASPQTAHMTRMP